jgi:hypothetical protein
MLIQQAYYAHANLCPTHYRWNDPSPWCLSLTLAGEVVIFS